MIMDSDSTALATVMAPANEPAGKLSRCEEQEQLHDQISRLPTREPGGAVESHEVSKIVPLWHVIAGPAHGTPTLEGATPRDPRAPSDPTEDHP